MTSVAHIRILDLPTPWIGAGKCERFDSADEDGRQGSSPCGGFSRLASAKLGCRPKIGARMQYQVDAHSGMFGWSDDSIGLLGACWNPRHSREGYCRCRFLIHDLEHQAEHGEVRHVGIATLIAKEPTAIDQAPHVTGLVGLYLFENERGKGYGRRVIEALLRVVEQDIEIHDISDEALGFWLKVGVTRLQTAHQTTWGVIPASHRIHLDNL